MIFFNFIMSLFCCIRSFLIFLGGLLLCTILLGLCWVLMLQALLGFDVECALFTTFVCTPSLTSLIFFVSTNATLIVLSFRVGLGSAVLMPLHFSDFIMSLFCCIRSFSIFLGDFFYIPFCSGFVGF